jgi:hypothetical protein
MLLKAFMRHFFIVAKEVIYELLLILSTRVRIGASVCEGRFVGVPPDLAGAELGSQESPASFSPSWDNMLLAAVSLTNI